MKKYVNRQTIMAFLLGIIICGAIPVHAAIEEFILYKADFHLVINGTEYKDVDLPLLSYKGFTYAPVRSVFNAAGMDVKWNGEIGQATVSTPTITPSVTPTPVPTITPTVTPTPTQQTLQQQPPTTVETPTAAPTSIPTPIPTEAPKTKTQTLLSSCSNCPSCGCMVSIFSSRTSISGGTEYFIQDCKCVNPNCKLYDKVVGGNTYKIEYK